MARKVWIQINGELIPKEEYIPPQSGNSAMILPDIQPYQSMIDGSLISSRSSHREHLRQHGCIEVGNETKHMKPYGDYTPPPGRKELLIQVANEKLRSK